MKKNKFICLVLVLLLTSCLVCFCFSDNFKPSGLIKDKLQNFCGCLFDRDYLYKKTVLQDSGEKVSLSALKKLKPVVGPYELAKFIKLNDNKPEIYSPDEKNLASGIFRANFHIHTLFSDGSISVEDVLNQAQDYAQKLPENQYMYIAITDHNTVLGAQEIIKTLLKNPPDKYSKIKIIPGIEIYTNFKNNIGSKNPVEIHVLTLCINPFDKNLIIQFDKKDLYDKWNWQERDFDSLVSFMKNYGIVGIAHPARYTSDLGDDKYLCIPEIMQRFAKAAKSDFPVFTEGYYQNYYDLGQDHNQYIDFINKTAVQNHIYRTGSTDAHGGSIFEKVLYKK